ncbi:MAG TPA: hypothetical protein PL151_00830 [Phycisphaerae bacterium]|nr:hypothetical protein [Phycisphaerae bacterium]
MGPLPGPPEDHPPLPGPPGHGLGVRGGPGGRRLGPGGPGRGPQGGPDDGSQLRPDEIDEFLDFARQHFPPLHDQLARARREDPRLFRQMLRQIGPPMTRLMRLWRDDPVEAERIIQIQQIEMRIREQHRKFQSLRSEAEKNAVRAEIRELLEKRFRLRLQRLENEVADLRRRLDEQTARLAEQNRNRDRLVEEELDRLLEGKPWDRGPRRNRPPSAESRPAN